MYHARDTVNFDIVSKLYSLPGIIVGLTVHEYAHAWMAYKLGDTTAKEDGRLTLNPLRHIDPVGFIFLLIAGFGWAKPVRFVRENLSHKRRDESLIALAGPFSNLLLGLLLSGVLAIGILGSARLGRQPSSVVVNLILYAIYINYGLFIFNLIPLPPLDGSHLFFSAVSLRPETEAMIFRYGSWALFGLIILGNATGTDLLPIGKLVGMIAGGVFKLFGLA
jgi:Zn-dependent protease